MMSSILGNSDSPSAVPYTRSCNSWNVVASVLVESTTKYAVGVNPAASTVCASVLNSQDNKIAFGSSLTVSYERSDGDPFAP